MKIKSFRLQILVKLNFVYLYMDHPWKILIIDLLLLFGVLVASFPESQWDRTSDTN